jgi:hypothetical protein
MEFVRLWECRFCNDHITMSDDEARAAVQDQFAALELHQLTRDHIRTKHPKMWPLWQRVMDEVRALKLLAEVGINQA